MRRRKWSIVLGIVFLVLLAVIGVAGCGSGAPKVDWTLEVSGAVDKPLSLAYSELAKMPQADLTEILMQKSRGEDEITAWVGVPLEEIFGQAGAAADYVAITALAVDGYAVEIPRDELEGAIVALRTGEDWIATADPDHGPIRLVCPDAPANRWVFQLQEIQVVGP